MAEASLRLSFLSFAFTPPSRLPLLSSNNLRSLPLERLLHPAGVREGVNEGSNVIIFSPFSLRKDLASSFDLKKERCLPGRLLPLVGLPALTALSLPALAAWPSIIKLLARPFFVMPPIFSMRFLAVAERFLDENKSNPLSCCDNFGAALLVLAASTASSLVSS